MKFWNQSINWKINKKYYPILGAFLLIIVGVSLKWRDRLYQSNSNQSNIYNNSNISDNSNSDINQELISTQFRVLNPVKYELFSPGDILRVRIDKVYLEPLDVKLLRLDNSKSDKPEIYAYNLGDQRFNSGEISINTKNYSNGQYKVVLLQNRQIVGESAVFTISNETQQLKIKSPLNMQIINVSDNIISWDSSPDIYFINIYLENDNERFVLAQNIVNTGQFIWDLTDRFGRSIVSGEYVLIIEDNFSKLEFGKVRFKVNN